MSSHAPARALRAVVLPLLCGLAAACGDPLDLERFGQRWPGLLQQRVRAGQRAAALGRALEADDSALRERAVLREVYLGPAGDELRFSRLAGGLGPAGQLLHEQLWQTAAAHAIELDRLPRPQQIERLLTRQRERAAAVRSGVPPPVPAIAELRRQLEALRAEGAEPGENSLLARLVAPDGDSGPTAIAAAEAAARWRALCEATARLELALADGLASLARELRRGHVGRTLLQRSWAEQDAATERMWRAVRPDHEPPSPWRPHTVFEAADAPQPDPRVYTEFHVRRLLADDLRAVRGDDDGATLRSLLQRLPLPVEQYRRLVRALARYREISARGGWPRLSRAVRLRPGQRHAQVAVLRRRLATEGLVATWTAEGDLFDAELQQAVRTFQAAHQLPATGVVDARTVAELDVPAGQRAATIALNLQRLRESALGAAGDGLEVRINIADFHLEVLRGEQRLLRQPVVVGKAAGTRCDEDTAQQLPAFATPQQSGRIAHLAFAPYWNVPRSIKETELDPERGKDPLYYEKHGYELLWPGTPFEWVRQLPGPANSLGFIKLIFPNPHETYLHDTPDKQLFARPRRSFSHGCIRVADVRSLARLLLAEHGQWDERSAARLYRDWAALDFAPLRERWDPERYARLVERAAELSTEVHLRRPVPIHVDYFTARVDDEGRVHFLHDVYGLDAAAQQQRSPASGPSCVPESELARRRFGDLLERLVPLDGQAPALGARVTAAAAVAARALDPASATPEQRRLRRRLARLAGFEAQHANLAARIRDEHGAISERLGGSYRRWQPRQVAAAVRVKRLVDGLEALHLEATAVASAIERLAPAAPASRPVDGGPTAR